MVKKTVRKIFVIQISLFIVGIIIIVFGMFYRQTIKNLDDKSILKFNAELDSLANEINFKALIAIENVKALSSRTMIRKILYSFSNNEISLDKAKKYTQPKYEDGVKVYSNIRFAVRTDVNGEVIAKYPKISIDISEFPEGNNINFIKTKEGYDVYIRTEIIHNNKLIGHDTGVFSLNCFPEEDSHLLTNIRIKDTSSENLTISNYSSSEPIGNTGYFVIADLDQNISYNQKTGITKSVILQTLLHIFAVLLISYFTIFRLTFKLMGKLDYTNSKLKKTLKEKDYLLKEVHHRIKNNFQSIGSLLSLQLNGITNPEAISALQDAIGRIESMQLLYEKFLLSEEYQITSVKNYVEDLIDEIIDLFPKTYNLTIKKHILDCKLGFQKLSYLGIIINELITNIMKYAFIGRESGLIDIAFSEVRGKAVLIIQDNGNGLPPGVDISKSTTFGIMLVKMISEQLDGNFVMENNNGIKSTLEFDI